MKIKTRFYLGISIVFGVLAVAVSIITVVLVDESVVRLSTKRVELNMNSAQLIFENKLQSILFVADLLADAIGSRGGDPAEEKDRLLSASKTYELEVLDLVDASRRVLFRAAAPALAGDSISGDVLIDRALETKKPALGTVLLPSERLSAEGGDLLSTCMANGGEPTGMFMGAAVPIFLKGGELRAVLECGVLLNGATDKVDRIRNLVFENKSYNGKPVGTATIFMRDLRISTNVLDGNNKRAIGTRASPEVVEHVLNGKRSWTGRAWVVDTTYLSRYDPIRDPRGDIIGMLYVGELEDPYKDMRAGAVVLYLLVILGGMALGFVVFVVIARRIIHPIGRLSYATQRLADGDLTHRVGNTSGDEVGKLSRNFDRMAEQLETGRREVEEKRRALESANEGLRVMNKNYMELLGFVSHELKNPLSSAIMGLYTVKDEYLGPIPPAQKKVLSGVAASLDYFKEIIKNYLDLSRLEKGEIEPRRTQVAFDASVVTPVVEGLEREMQERKMVLRKDVPAGLSLNADKDLLRIVVDNLVANAIKYGREGGVLGIEARAEGAEVIASVYNEGEGIPRDKLSLLFKKFSRVYDPKHEGKKGTGLGLYICKEIIEKHKGRIWAESEEGRWARFTFALPANHA